MAESMVEWVNPLYNKISEVTSPTMTILNLKEMVKDNYELYKVISCRLEHLENLLRSIQKYQLSAEVRDALENLESVLNSAEKMIKEFNDAWKATQVWNSGSYKLEVDKLNQRLTNASEKLTGTLHVHQEKKLTQQQQRLDEQDKTLKKIESDLKRKSSCIIQ